MKYLDSVRLKVSKPEYEKHGVFKGATGAIIMSEMRYNHFDVEFFDKSGRDYAIINVHIEDMEVIEESDITDDIILKDLPLNDPHWWCKVEDGYILNLLGEKKNKIPYDYNS